jgi:gliding motility-associated-like protein
LSGKHLHIIAVLLLFLCAERVWADCLPVTGLGNEIRICRGASVVLNAQNPGSSYQWNTGATSQTITVNQSGVYWVVITNSCGSVTDSVEVFVDDPVNLNFGGVVGLCPTSNDTLYFTMPGGYSYLWSNSGTTNTMAVTQPGTYWGTFTNACGTFSDTFQVVYSTQPIFSLGPDTTICAGTGFRLYVPPNLGNISWSTGATGTSIPVFTTGQYSATITNSCGSYTDNIYVTVLPTPDPIVPDTIGSCLGDPVPVSAFVNSPANTTIQWSNNTSGNNTTYYTSGNQSVTINGPCIQTTTNFYIDVVNPLTPPDLGDDVVLCGPITYNANVNGPVDIMWHDGSDENSIEITTTTLVTLTLTNACGSVSDSVWVYTLMPPEEELPDTFEICPGDLGIATILAPNADSASYLWHNGDTTDMTIITQVGWHWVEVSNRCGTIIDSAYVALIPDMLPIDFQDDTVFCQGANLTINAIDSNGIGYYSFSYEWYRNGVFFSNYPQVMLSATGTYVLIKSNTCSEMRDTVRVEVIPKPVRKFWPETYACNGDTVWLRPDTIGTYFQWSNGYNGVEQPVTQSGFYSVTVGNICDTLVDSTEVIFEDPFPFFMYSDSIIACEGPVTMHAPVSGQRYRWFNGWFGESWTVYTSGRYRVEVFNACDTIVDTITVLITGPPQSMMGTFVTVCRGNSIVLDAGNPGSIYHWNTNEYSRAIVVSDPGWYYVDIENDCGTLRDSIEVIVVDPVNLALIDDTVMCLGEQLELDGGNVHSTYLWNTGETTKVITVDTTGIYYVTVTNVCGARTDSLYVEFLGTPEFSIDSLYKCVETDYITVAGPPGDLKYQWSTGDTTRHIQIAYEGWYTLEVDNGCFTYLDSFWVMEEYPVELTLGADTIVCARDGLMLEPEAPPGRVITWNEDYQGSYFYVTVPGRYSASVQNSCGIFGDTIEVFFDEELPDEPYDHVLCKDDTLVYNLRRENHREVIWFDGDTSLVREFVVGGRYNYIITNTCGVYDQVLEVREENCECPFFIPNSFTPNDDGVNDLFEYKYDCEITSFTIRIFNRWGQQLFHTTDINSFWDGHLNGKKIQTGVYMYVMHYSWNIYERNMSRERQGVVYIVR